ncbi:cupin domain-containing protein [Dictyobacter kobayashii]|uniref:Cupin type-2 domain-containing protein n=1 Tax=Dictyobacter kobayashii TaxID=2014872 RepID=A0A402AU24_9CHLR|nr:cupin domain-containing protein [Dictyobacter kobayashii]GCE22612.1 hypothetical protein KDK_64120 [Dictyobacter kobayashii]
MMAEQSDRQQTIPYARNLHDALKGDELLPATYLAKGEDTAGQLTLSEAIIHRGQEPLPHTHTREDEAFYILEGAATFTIGQQSFPVSAGTFIWLPRDQQHSFIIHTETARVLVFILPSGLEHYFEKMGQLFQQEHVQAGQLSPATAHKWQLLSQQFGITLNLPETQTP